MMTIETWVFVTLYFGFGLACYLLGAQIQRFIFSRDGDRYDDYTEDDDDREVEAGQVPGSEARG
jgi:hypothetical protein